MRKQMAVFVTGTHVVTRRSPAPDIARLNVLVEKRQRLISRAARDRARRQLDLRKSRCLREAVQVGVGDSELPRQVRPMDQVVLVERAANIGRAQLIHLPPVYHVRIRNPCALIHRVVAIRAVGAASAGDRNHAGKRISR